MTPEDRNEWQIPGIIKALPTYGGEVEPNKFIEQVEKVLTLVKDTENTPYGEVLLGAIRNKFL